MPQAGYLAFLADHRARKCGPLDDCTARQYISNVRHGNFVRNQGAWHGSESTPIWFIRPHRLKPEDFLHFVETDEFRHDWEELGLDSEMDLWALQIAIMNDPKGAPVTTGTGGLRKMRFAPAGWHVGKSGAVRICYAYFPKHWMVLLVMAYPKGRKETLTKEEKAGIKQYLEIIEKWLDERNR